MQVEPTKPVLKAPGIKLLKLEYDEPLSKFAFKFNLRRYTEADLEVVVKLIDSERNGSISKAEFASGLVAGAYTRPLLSPT